MSVQRWQRENARLTREASRWRSRAITLARFSLAPAPRDIPAANPDEGSIRRSDTRMCRRPGSLLLADEQTALGPGGHPICPGNDALARKTARGRNMKS